MKPSDLVVLSATETIADVVDSLNVLPLDAPGVVNLRVRLASALAAFHAELGVTTVNPYDTDDSPEPIAE